MKEGYSQIGEGALLNPHVADLHIHTHESDGHLTPEQVVDLATELQLDAIAVTDHNMVRPSEIAWNYGQRKNSPVQIVLGSEIDTREGHLLGLFLTNDIEERMPIEETIDAIHAQGGLAIVPHPSYPLAGISVKLNRCIELASGPHDIDGIEIFNAGVDFRNFRKSERQKDFTDTNKAAQSAFRRYRNLFGAPLGTTDSHFNAIGIGVTGYLGNLKEALRSSQTIAMKADMERIQQVIKTSEALFGPLNTTRLSMRNR